METATKKRIIYSILGIFLLVLDVWLIYQVYVDSNNRNYVFWSTLVTAILVPIGIDLIKHSTSHREHEALIKLASIPEIQSLIDEASKKETTVHALREEIQHLAEIVEKEAIKQTLQKRKASLENEAIELINELDVIDKELNILNIRPQSSIAQKEIEALSKQIESRVEKDIVFRLGKRIIVLEKDWFSLIPFGSYFYQFFSFLQEIREK